MLRTKFIPTQHGFQFANNFINVLLDVSNIRIATRGRCGGMAYAALDYYMKGIPTPQYKTIDEGFYTTGSPAVCSWSEQRLDIFAPKTDNAIWHKWRDESGWHEWISLGGNSTSDPAAVSWGKNRIDLFIRGTDKAIYHKWWNGSQWLGWQHLGGAMQSGPSVTSLAPGHLAVFAQGPNNELLVNQFLAGHWHGWRSTGGETTARPYVVSDQTNIHIFALDQNSTLYYQQRQIASCSAWEQLPGTLVSSPTGCKTRSTQLDIFGQGTDNAIWHNYLDHEGWHTWSSLGGIATAAPSAISRSEGSCDIFIRGTDNAIWHKAYAQQSWQKWERIDTSIPEDAYRLTNHIYLRQIESMITIWPFGRASDFALYTIASDNDLFHWSTQKEFNKLQAYIHAGTPVPLGLIGVTDLKQIGENHQVIACGYELDANQKDFSILIYDPNHPGQEVTLHTDSVELCLRSSQGRRWRGFFVRDDYSPRTPPVCSPS